MNATSDHHTFENTTVNNIDNLIPIKLKQQTIVKDSSGLTTRTFDREMNAYTGDYNTSIVNTYSVDIVQILTPDDSIKYAFHLYGRFLKNKDLVYKTGVGFYIFPKGKIFGGIFIESNDLTNKTSNTPNFFKRVDIGLTVKFVLPSLGKLNDKTI